MAVTTATALAASANRAVPLACLAEVGVLVCSKQNLLALCKGCASVITCTLYLGLYATLLHSLVEAAGFLNRKELFPCLLGN